MDGNFLTDDVQASTTNLVSPTLKAMVLAEKSLGGRKCWRGEVTGLLGLLRRGFDIQSTGKLDARGLVFDEKLEFDDGEIQERSWRIGQSADGLLIEADGIDLLEPGQVKNNALIFVYQLKFGSLSFRYRDKFFLDGDGNVNNVGRASWCGLPVMKIFATGKPVA